MTRTIFIVALLVFFSPVVRGEVEPNDTISEANSLGELSPAQALTATGHIGSNLFPDMDVDIYSLEVLDGVAPLRVSIAVDVDAGIVDFDALARLFDANGVELSRNDDRAFADPNPRIEAYLLDAGTYHVAVSHALNPHFDPTVAGSGRPYGVGGDYTLSVGAVSAGIPVSSLEPNDDVSLASGQGTGSFTVSGEFIGDGPNGALDVDVYKISLPGAARIDVRVDTSSIGSILRPALRLSSCQDHVVDFQPSYPCGLGESVPLAAGGADASVSTLVLDVTEVYIMVSGEGNRRYDPALSGSGERGSMGAYDLEVVVTPFDPFGPNEPNDSVSTATGQPFPFTNGSPNTISYQGYLGDGPYALTRGDRDFYQIELLEGARVVTFEVEADDPVNGLRPIIAVYDKDRQLIASNENPGESGTVSETVILDCSAGLLADMPSFVMVMSTRQDWPADITLPIENGQLSSGVDRTIGRGHGTVGGYELRVTAAPVDGPCGSEPNNTLATASSTGLVDEGVYICENGALDDGDCLSFQDVDMYSVRVDRAPASLQVRVSLCGAVSICDAAIIVFDSGGADVASFPNGPVFCTGKAEVVFPPVELDAEGTYFVAVTADFSAVFDPTESCPAEVVSDIGSYGLMLSLTPSRLPNLSASSHGGVASAGATPNEVFVTRLDDAATWIDVLDPVTLAVLRSFPAPEPRFGGAEGLAYDGTHLYYVGSGQYPIMYQLDPADGTVLDSTLLWMGSGFYTDATVLGRTLYVLDVGLQAIHSFDLTAQRFLASWLVGWQHGIEIGGGLAGVEAPNRLFVADAFGTGEIHVLHPAAGALVDTIVPHDTDQRPVSLASNGTGQLLMADFGLDGVDVLDRSGAVLNVLSLDAPVSSIGGTARLDNVFDINGDGDVDLRDFAMLQACFRGDGEPIPPACVSADENADSDVDLGDAAALLVMWSGP